MRARVPFGANKSAKRIIFLAHSLGGASGGGGAHKSICNFFQQRQQQALCLHTRTPPAHTPGVSHATESREADYCAITHLVVRSSAPLSLITNEQRARAPVCVTFREGCSRSSFFQRQCETYRHIYAVKRQLLRKSVAELKVAPRLRISRAHFSPWRE
jgi:hypothetical protein